MTVPVLVLGFGSFGRALFHAFSANPGVRLSVYLRKRGVKADFSAAEAVFHDLAEIPIDRFKIVIVAVPSYAVEAVVGALPLRRDGTDPVFLSCAKGIDFTSEQFPSEILARLTASQSVGALSGPSFTDEILANKRTFMALATPDRALAVDLAGQLATRDLHLLPTDDVHGLEMLSVAKNIIALGAGIADGQSLGENFRAAFVARGVAELVDSLARLGGRQETLLSIGGLGDILLTCVSPRSRNYRMGYIIGSHSSVETIMSEGLSSATAFVRYLRDMGHPSAYFERVAAAIDAPDGILDVLD